jgi:hypothetical protein
VRVQCDAERDGWGEVRKGLDGRQACRKRREVVVRKVEKKG